MIIDLSEKQIIYILNCINYTSLKLAHHPTLEQKKELQNYFNFENYEDYYNDLLLLHRLISTKGNKELYNLPNEQFFKGQAQYLCSVKKDFSFLEEKKTIKFSFFRKSIDKLKQIV